MKAAQMLLIAIPVSKQAEGGYLALPECTADNQNENAECAGQSSDPGHRNSKERLPSNRNDGDRSERSARRDAQRVWSSQRIAQHRLKERSRQ